MTSQDLVRNKRHVEVLAARAELLVQIAGDNQRLRSELNSTLAKAYTVLDLIDKEPVGFLFIPALQKRLESVVLN
jgi:hypothetical protein